MSLTINATLAKHPCAFSPFGAAIVNKQTREILCFGFNNANGNPTWHGEMEALNNCSALFPGNGLNSAFWKKLTLYTTGEPCPMCQAAILWARIGRVVYSTSIATLTRLGWSQIQVTSLELSNKATAGHFKPLEIIPALLHENTDHLFAWQYDTHSPCPSGCLRRNDICVPSTST
ncbi:cytidine deaminase-like protein [Basidiobolus meristosporus CBS 931.73]|uniref:Cytidine deaminase-like protein n=1 Tax=Basidiobolus meristosporus CBS 931.73 TaxID=1314790 RepID=A0A1Y1YGM8_9FUNG|nr:cytidine deaminase-like protein [Basidiobolus meristosporus CBS 931.73]|eukprot:ORX97200.1 cytidine deaminase-like protein [Basidiobolus meristosporus CBS 931.73]